MREISLFAIVPAGGVFPVFALSIKKPERCCCSAEESEAVFECVRSCEHLCVCLHTLCVYNSLPGVIFALTVDIIGHSASSQRAESCNPPSHALT